MTDVTYEIVQHNCGWAYKVNDVFSESFPTHADAFAAAQAAAAEQEISGHTEAIEWHAETASGRDRPLGASTDRRLISRGSPYSRHSYLKKALTSCESWCRRQQ